MAENQSNEVKTRIIRQKQKNGDIYVIERQTRYDPVKKYNVVISGKLIGKIPAGSTEMIPTRDKRKAQSAELHDLTNTPEGPGKAGRPDDNSSLVASNITDLPEGSVLAYDIKAPLSSHPLVPTDGWPGISHAGSALSQTGYSAVTLNSERHLLILSDKGPELIRRSGNQPDALSISNALEKANIPEGSRVEVITDCAFYSEKALAGLVSRGLHFISPISTDIKWVREILDQRTDEFNRTSRISPSDPDIRALTVTIAKEFTLPGKPSGGASIARKLYLHLCFSSSRKEALDSIFDLNISELKGLIEEGASGDELTESASDAARRFLLVRHFGDNIIVKLNDTAISKHMKNNGFFALVSDCEGDAFTAISRYCKIKDASDSSIFPQTQVQY